MKNTRYLMERRGVIPYLWRGLYIPGDVTGSGWEYVNVFNRFENNVIVGFQSWIYRFNEEEDGTGL